MPNGMASPEFPPLLPIGRHQKTMTELRKLCVEEFPLSKTRDTIMRGLEQVVGMLRNKKIQGELWVNGSFLTQKIDPNDVDIILLIQGIFYDNAKAEQKACIEWVNDNLEETHHCDSYVHVEWPESHPRFWFGEYMRTWWFRQWGFARDGVTMKGIAVVSLGET
jgi:hypothetical protein